SERPITMTIALVTLSSELVTTRDCQQLRKSNRVRPSRWALAAWLKSGARRTLYAAAFSVAAFVASVSLPESSAVAATFYVNNSCAVNGNGTAATCAASGGGAGAWDSLGGAANCTGMAPGDHLQMRAGTGGYKKGYYATLTPNATKCSGTANNPILLENHPNENVVLDGAENIKGTTAKWTAVGNGVYLCNSGTCGTPSRWPLMAWYSVNNGPEKEVYLQHTSRVCDSTVPAGWMRYTTGNAVCVHLSENLNPGSDSVTYFKTNTNLGAGIQLHVSPGVKHWRVQRNPLGGSFTIKRYRDYGVVANTSVNVDITIDGLDIGYMMDRCVNYDTGV